MIENEGRRIAGIPKWGEPRDQWSQDRPNTLTNAFGLVNAEGQTIKGLLAEFEIFVSPRLGQTKYVFSLKQFELGRVARVYQQEVNFRRGIHPSDHGYSHEHYGEPRFKADASWACARFEDAVLRFCDKANVSFTAEMPHYQGFVLK
jgi:hypothetical protein